MTKDLIATFGKSDGGTHNWKYRDLDPNLTALQISLRIINKPRHLYTKRRKTI